MKKWFSLFLAFVLVLSMTACGSSNSVDDQVNQAADEPAKTQQSQDIPSNTPDVTEIPEIAEPVMNWFIIDDFATGIPRLVMEFTNPNSTAIDFEVDVTFFENGDNKGIAEGLYKMGVPAGEKCIIWSNWEIPQADKLDLKFSYLAESDKTPVSCTYQEAARSDASVTLECVPQGAFEQCVVDVIGTLNGSKVSHMTYDFYDPDSNEFCFEGESTFDSYEVYINCF